MKYSSSLLKKFIGINDTPENIAKNLILKTCEIEEIGNRNIPDDVIIGKVTEFHKHPEADKLNVCTVNCGDKGTFQICCGGENMAQDILVPVAIPGCYLPAIDIKIEPRKLKGIMSNGMICSKEELGIKEDLDLHDIWNLADDFDDISDEDIGTPIKAKYPWMEGYVLEVDNKSLTNRPDLTGHWGAAVELNSIYNSVKGAISFNKVLDYFKQFEITNIIETLDNSSKGKKKIISETNGLNTYILMEINNVDIKKSSIFARIQTTDMGSNPINNWVDFSNLFMLISGQPIHFFDADKIEGDITVRNANEGEEFTDLFEAKHILKDTDIVIADDKKILALAGVVGGLESGVTDSTKNILVEIANFDSVAVRKTGTRLGLRTDAELRYEKNINPIYSLYCLLLFLDEVKYYSKDLGSYEIGGLDYYASKNVISNIKEAKKIDINFEKMSEFIFGRKINDLAEENKNFEEASIKHLQGLGFVLNNRGSRTVPMWRGPDDINITEDIYEEVSRLYGYENIPNEIMLSETVNVAYTDMVGLNRKLEEILVNNLGFTQTETYPWVSEKVLNEFERKTEDLYMLQNPVNPEMPYMRDDMIYGLIPHVAKNSKFFDEFKLFDIGKVWNKKETIEGEVGKFASFFVNEKANVGMMIYVKDIKNREKDPILSAKEMINVILKNLGIDDNILLDKTDSLNFHPKKQAKIIVKEKEFGFIGALHPLVLKNYKIAENAGVVYVSLDMDQIIACLSNSGEKQYHYETLQDQIVYRDLCFVLDTDKDFGGVIDAVKGLEEVKDLEVFDIYSGDNLGENKKSVSIKIKIVGNGSMTTEQINDVMNKAINAAGQAGGKLRE